MHLVYRQLVVVMVESQLLQALVVVLEVVVLVVLVVLEHQAKEMMVVLDQVVEVMVAVAAVLEMLELQDLALQQVAAQVDLGKQHFLVTQVFLHLMALRDQQQVDGLLAVVEQEPGTRVMELRREMVVQVVEEKVHLVQLQELLQ